MEQGQRKYVQDIRSFDGLFGPSADADGNIGQHGQDADWFTDDCLIFASNKL